jgi:hypothetical protein
MKAILKKILWRLLSKFKKNYPYILKNLDLNKKIKKDKIALLLFKTFPVFINSKKRNTHQNNDEIILLIKSLNLNGYKVDLIDREFIGAIPEKEYDIFIGLAAGNSGVLFNKIAEQLTRTIIIPLCLGPYPLISNKMINSRYKFFYKRNKLIDPLSRNTTPMRMITKIDFDITVKISDYLLVIGEKKSFSSKSYSKTNKPIFNYFPYIQKRIFKLDSKKNLNNFICFAGNGFIVKGVDLVVDIFLDFPHLNLEIYGPASDSLFLEHYSDKIKNSRNIKFQGFIDIGSKEFENVCNRNSFQIFLSCSEGMATSVLTCMTYGIVPIITYQTSIDADLFGFIVNEDDPQKIVLKAKEYVQIASKMDSKEFQWRRQKTIEYGKRF